MGRAGVNAPTVYTPRRPEESLPPRGLQRYHATTTGWAESAALQGIWDRIPGMHVRRPRTALQPTTRTAASPCRRSAHIVRELGPWNRYSQSGPGHYARAASNSWKKTAEVNRTRNEKLVDPVPAS